MQNALLIFLLTFIMGAPTFAQEASFSDQWQPLSDLTQLDHWSENELLIRHPSVSSNCQRLLLERLDKKKLQLSLLSLEKRIKKIMKKTPKQKKSIRHILESRYFQVKRMEALASMQIQHKEEKIVRQGCPGLKY